MQPTPAAATLLAMHGIRNLCGILCLASILVSLSACGTSNAERERKREQDRLAIHLTEAQQQVDQCKAQLEKSQSALAQEQGKNAAAQQQLEGLRGQLADMKSALQKEQTARAGEQADAKHANTDAQKRIAELTQEKASLEQKLAASQPATAPASTMPDLLLNK